MRKRSESQILRILIKEMLRKTLNVRSSRLMSAITALILGLFWYAKDKDANPTVIIIGILFLLMLLWFGRGRKNRISYAEIKDKTTLHIDVLARKYRKCLVKDEYGFTTEVGFDRELNYFIEKAFPKADEKEYPYLRKQITSIVTEYIETHDVKDDSEDYSSLSTGADFEKYGFDELSKAGFNVSLLAKSGDQGVDLLVTLKNGKKVAVQCKFYSKPVGNKAVQEVISGKGFYECDYAAVLSNETYTKSAQVLAASSGVELFSDITMIKKWLLSLG